MERKSNRTEMLSDIINTFVVQHLIFTLMLISTPSITNRHQRDGSLKTPTFIVA